MSYCVYVQRFVLKCSNRFTWFNMGIGQNNEGRSLFDKKFANKEKWRGEGRRLINEFSSKRWSTWQVLVVCLKNDNHGSTERRSGNNINKSNM